MLAGQDDALDRIGDVVDNIKLENQNFSVEVKGQNKMLDKINDDIDKTTADMIKLDTKLKGLLARGSICKLWMCIILEFIIFCSMISVILGG